MLTVHSRGWTLWAVAAFMLSSCHAQGAGFDAGRAYNVCLVKGVKTGVSGMRLPVWRPYLLLKDGSAYENPRLPPESIVAASSRQGEVGQRGEWTQQGSGVALNMASRDPMSSAQCVPPSPSGMTLQGSYKHVGGGGTIAGGGQASFMRSDRYRFSTDGSFRSESSSGLMSPGASAVSETGHAGHYQIHDYSIALRYDDGTEATLFFYTDERQLVHIGDEDYVPATD